MNALRLSSFKFGAAGVVLALVLGGAGERAVRAATALDSLQVDRLEQRELGVLDAAVLEQVALSLGRGQFYALAPRISLEQAATNGWRALFLFPSLQDLKAGKPRIRFLLEEREGRSRGLVAASSSERLLALFWRAALSGPWSEEKAAAMLSQALPATLYAGTARLLPLPEASAPGEPHGTRPAELVALSQSPLVTRDEVGRVIWRGRFLREDGGVEEVTVLLPRSPAEDPEIVRSTLKPAQTFAAVPFSETAAEQWIIDAPAAWNPTRRYQLKLALNAMRDDPRQKYQLGVALLDDPRPGANAEGLKLIRESAAAGYQDALNLLQDWGAGSPRPMVDREKARLDR
jgi:hypothetical protein